MKSNAATVPAYMDSLPADRREALQAVRKVILKNLGNEFHECMQYGVVAYCVPHTIWPHGHHTRPELPLMYMGFSSQKNDMVVYMLFLLHNTAERAWFDKAWKATGRKNYLEVGGMGCCLRFKKLEDLSLEVIIEAMSRVPVQKYLEDHAAMLRRIGKPPGTQPAKKSKAKPAAAKSKPASPTKKPPSTPKPTKKKSPAKR